MQVIEVMRQFADHLRKLSKGLESGKIVFDDKSKSHQAPYYAVMYNRWADVLGFVGVLMEEEVDANPGDYIGIGPENWSGLKDKDGDNLNCGDVAFLPMKDDDPLYYVIEFIQNEWVSSICKVSGDTRSDLGTDAASRLKRVGPGSEHPELMKIIRGED